MRRFSVITVVFQAILLLCGCTAMPVSSMIALSKVDAMTSDLSRLRIALAMPQALLPKAGGVNLDVAVGYGGKEPVKTVIALEQSTDAADLVGLPSAVKPAQHTHVFKLSETGIAKLNRIRMDAKRAQAEKRGGSLAMGVSAKAFCLAAPLPNGPLLTTTWMLTSETMRYVVLVQDFDLRDDKTVAASLTQIRSCES